MPRRTVHYAWVVAAVTFLVLLVTAGIRATPGVLMVPLENEFGWNRAAISAAIAINIALFGLIGPFAASVMDRVGLRRVILCALALLALSVALTTRMEHQRELVLLWGILVGAGTVVTSMVLAAVVASRWFDERPWASSTSSARPLGASLAAFGAGAIRTVLGNYDLAFWISGALCLVAGAAFLAIGRRTFTSTPIDMPMTVQAG